MSRCLVRTSLLSVTPGPIPGLARELALTLAGKLGPAEVETLRTFLAAFLAGGGRFLVLDVRGIVHACSAGLGHLVKTADQLTARGGGLALVGADARLRIVIEMLGLDAYFLLCESLDEAVRALPRRVELLAATHAKRVELAARHRARAEAEAQARRAAALEAQDAALVALTTAGPGVMARLVEAWSGGAAVVARVRTLEEPTRTWCLELEGPFDERAPALWSDAVRRGRAAGVTAFALDLRQATRLGPSTLGWLVRWARELREVECALAFVDAAPRVCGLLRRHDLDRHFNVGRPGGA